MNLPNGTEVIDRETLREFTAVRAGPRSEYSLDQLQVCGMDGHREWGPLDVVRVVLEQRVGELLLR